MVRSSPRLRAKALKKETSCHSASASTTASAKVKGRKQKQASPAPSSSATTAAQRIQRPPAEKTNSSKDTRHSRRPMSTSVESTTLKERKRAGGGGVVLLSISLCLVMCAVSLPFALLRFRDPALFASRDQGDLCAESPIGSQESPTRGGKCQERVSLYAGHHAKRCFYVPGKLTVDLGVLTPRNSADSTDSTDSASSPLLLFSGSPGHVQLYSEDRYRGNAAFIQHWPLELVVNSHVMHDGKLFNNFTLHKELVTPTCLWLAQATGTQCPKTNSGIRAAYGQLAHRSIGVAGGALEAAARAAHNQRAHARMWARGCMWRNGMWSQLSVLGLGLRDWWVHGATTGPTFESLVARYQRKHALEKRLEQRSAEEAAYKAIIDSSKRTNEKVDAAFLTDDHSQTSVSLSVDVALDFMPQQ